jgi:putative transposase
MTHAPADPAKSPSAAAAVAEPSSTNRGAGNAALTKDQGEWTIEIIKRSDTAKGFVLLPRRWVVERTFTWLNRNRRLAKDVERTIDSAATWLYLASAKLMSRRLAAAR